MPAIPRIFLIKELQRHLRLGHPWVFSDAVRVPPKTPSGVVALCESGSKARFVAYGLYQADSSLAFRVLSLEESKQPDAALIERRLGAALSLRQSLIDPKTTNAYRLLHGEGDLLPGVICDIYASVAVLKYDSPSAKAFYDETLVSLLQAGFVGGVSALYERFYSRQEEQQAKGTLRFGTLADPEVEVIEHSMKLGVDVALGQKTGFFLDQRENRRLVRSLALGRSVLNCFSYTGGFSVAAALGGATQTTSVDISAPVIEAAKKNFSRNGLPVNAHRFYAEDAFEFLRREPKQKYQLVILDPPSFAPNEKSKPQAIAAYKELNVLGLQRLEEGGFFCTASCSSHIKEEEFLAIVRDAAGQVRRPLRVISKLGAGPDHPMPPAFTEGGYLKFIVAY